MKLAILILALCITRYEVITRTTVTVTKTEQLKNGSLKATTKEHQKTKHRIYYR